MSATELFVVLSNGDVVEQDEALRNSWGSAPRIWDAIFKAHFRFDRPERYPREFEYANPIMLDGTDQQRFWDLHKNEALPRSSRRVFAWTFDEVIVPKAECAALADDVDAFNKAYPTVADRVNHLPALAAWLRKCAERPDIEGVAVNWTTVNADPWASKPVTDEEDCEDYRPWNVKKDGGQLLSAIVS